MQQVWSLKFPTLSTPSQDQVLAYRNLIVKILESEYEQINWKGGPLADLILGPLSYVLAAIDKSIEEYKGTEDPSVGLQTGNYDFYLLEQKLVALGIKRKPATKASGKLALILNEDVSFNLNFGTKFKNNIGGLAFVPKKNYFIQSSSTYTAFLSNSGLDPSTIVPLIPITGNKYRAIIEIEAEQVGTDYHFQAGTVLQPTVPINSLHKAYLTTATTGGYAGETDSELYSYLRKLSFSPPTTTTKNGIDLMISRNLTNPVDWKVVGIRDPEMRRGVSILNLADGRKNIYVKWNVPYPLLLITKQAQLIGKNGSIGTWQTVFPAQDYPGLFFIEKVLLLGQDLTSPSLSFTQSLGVNIFDGQEYKYNEAVEMLGSSYGQLTVQFTDPTFNVTNVPLNSLRFYDFWVVGLPQVYSIQKDFNNDSYKNVNEDNLVKFAWPVEVTQVNVNVQASSANFTIADVKAAVAEAINSYPISNVLAFNEVEKIARSFLPENITLTISSVSATLTKRDFSKVNFSSNNNLIIPDDYANEISNKTVSFYTDESKINVTVS